MFENYLLISKITSQTLDQYWWTLVSLGQVTFSWEPAVPEVFGVSALRKVNKCNKKERA